MAELLSGSEALEAFSAPYDLNKFNATKSKSNAISSIIILSIIACLLSSNSSENRV